MEIIDGTFQLLSCLRRTSQMKRPEYDLQLLQYLRNRPELLLLQGSSQDNNIGRN